MAAAAVDDAAVLANSLLHDNRVEEGSVNIAPAALPETTVPEGTNARQVVRNLLDTLNRHLNARDWDGIAALFAEQGMWRDHLAVSWDFRSVQGPKQVATLLAKAASSPGQQQLTKVELDESQPQRAPAVAHLDALGKSPCIAAYITFTTAVGTGRGFVRLVRLVHEASPGPWKIYTFYTALHELTGFEQPLGARRPLGASHGGGRNMKNWREQRDEDTAFTASEPSVVIIGAGQGGLTLAARLKMLGVRTLVVDREQRVGDNWRKRYRQLVLHDPVWFDHMPYLPFPAFWPVFTPKDKLADFFEAYVSLLELDVWTQTEVRGLQYDAAAKRYTITLERHVVVDASGREGGPAATTETRVFHPQHIVQATGHSGKKNMPDVPGMDTFAGELLCHSSEFPGARPAETNTDAAEQTVKTRRAVVVGSCNSGHDIAQDLHENGYHVTMVQRSSTCVVSSAAIVKIGMGSLYAESVQATLPCDDADLVLWSAPTPLSKAVQVQAAQLIAELDAPLLAGLRKVGFQLDRGPDGAGLFYKYFERGGGYYIDVGASQLIVQGKIQMQSGQGVSRVTPMGLDLADGTHLDADVVVFATGYQNMRTQTRVLFGDGLADKTRDVWGFDGEGEFRTMWRRSGQPGYWYMGGNLALARYFSRFLALQIKAQQEGLMAYE